MAILASRLSPAAGRILTSGRRPAGTIRCRPAAGWPGPRVAAEDPAVQAGYSVLPGPYGQAGEDT